MFAGNTVANTVKFHGNCKSNNTFKLQLWYFNQCSFINNGMDKLTFYTKTT